MDNILLIFFILLNAGSLGYLIWVFRRLEQNFFSFADFANNKLSEIEADVNLCKVTLQGQYEGLQLLANLSDLNSLETDIVKVDLYGTLFNYYHLDNKYNPVKVSSSFERQMSLAAIEMNIPKRAKMLGVDVQTIRPEGK